MARKTWIDSKGVQHEYVKDAYETFRKSWARKQALKQQVTMASLRSKFINNTKPVDRISEIQAWARSQKWSSYYGK